MVVLAWYVSARSPVYAMYALLGQRRPEGGAGCIRAREQLEAALQGTSCRPGRRYASHVGARSGDVATVSRRGVCAWRGRRLYAGVVCELVLQELSRQGPVFSLHVL